MWVRLCFVIFETTLYVYDDCRIRIFFHINETFLRHTYMKLFLI